jgi:hypothetical protein
MSPEGLREELRRQPFRPIPIVLTDGQSHDPYHPDLAMVGRREVIIGVPADPNSDLWERTVRLELLHVVRVGPLTAPGTSPRPDPDAGPGAS